MTKKDHVMEPKDTRNGRNKSEKKEDLVPP